MHRYHYCLCTRERGLEEGRESMYVRVRVGSCVCLSEKRVGFLNPMQVFSISLTAACNCCFVGSEVFLVHQP